MPEPKPATQTLFGCRPYAFSRKHSEGFPLIVGGLGVGPVFASRVLCRRLSSSCRRNSVPIGKVAEGFMFGCFQCDVASFRVAGVAGVAGVALCHMWTCVVPRRVVSAILLRHFQKMSCIFFVAGAALWTCPSSCFVAGAALQTCHVPCFLRTALKGLREVVTKCKLRGRRGNL